MKSIFKKKNKPDQPKVEFPVQTEDNWGKLIKVVTSKANKVSFDWMNDPVTGQPILVATNGTFKINNFTNDCVLMKLTCNNPQNYKQDFSNVVIRTKKAALP